MASPGASCGKPGTRPPPCFGKAYVSPIITQRLPLSRYAEAFDLVAQGVAGKVVLLPQESDFGEPESTPESMVNEGGAL